MIDTEKSLFNMDIIPTDPKELAEAMRNTYGGNARMSNTKVQDVVLDSHTGEVLDVLESEGAYVAIPIETLDKVIELLDDARGFLYVGNTQRAMNSLDALKKELNREEVN